MYSKLAIYRFLVFTVIKNSILARRAEFCVRRFCRGPKADNSLRRSSYIHSRLVWSKVCGSAEDRGGQRISTLGLPSIEYANLVAADRSRGGSAAVSLWSAYNCPWL